MPATLLSKLAAKLPCQPGAWNVAVAPRAAGTPTGGSGSSCLGLLSSVRRQPQSLVKAPGGQRPGPASALLCTCLGPLGWQVAAAQGRAWPRKRCCSALRPEGFTHRVAKPLRMGMGWHLPPPHAAAGKDVNAGRPPGEGIPFPQRQGCQVGSGF